MAKNLGCDRSFVGKHLLVQNFKIGAKLNLKIYALVQNSKFLLKIEILRSKIEILRYISALFQKNATFCCDNKKFGCDMQRN